MDHASWQLILAGDRCASCRRPGSPLCRPCAAAATRAGGGPPPRGARRLAAGWEYGGPARVLVLALKERGRRRCALPLADAAARAVWRAGLAADVLTWVPARRAEVRRRGFDHGEVLARAVGTRLGLQVRPLLRRARPAQDQVGLSATARRANLRGAFVAVGPSPARVALVDDVLTTGATAAACAAALRRAGARWVEVVVACRTP